MNKRQKILIADDAKFNRDILKEFLGETYDYLEAENGNQVIQMIGENISTRRLTDWRSMSASIVFSTMTVPERKLSKDLQMSIPTVSVTHRPCNILPP